MLGVVIIFIILTLILTKAFLYRSDYFRLRAIEVNNILPEGVSAPNIKYDQLLGFYKGKNIFKTNLKDIAYFFQEGYPDAKHVRANIVLPDKILVNIKCRWPVAVLKGDRPYLVDEEGYVLSSYYTLSPSNFPVIEGVNPRYLGRYTKKINLNNLKLALELLKAINRSKYIMKFGLASINAQDAASLSFSLSNGIEIRVGSENFEERLRLLEKTLRDPRLILNRIEYIDVRFKDVIIGPK